MFRSKYFDTSIFSIFFRETCYFLWILPIIKKRKKIGNEVFDNNIESTDILLELFDSIEDIIVDGSTITRTC